MRLCLRSQRGVQVVRASRKSLIRCIELLNIYTPGAKRVMDGHCSRASMRQRADYVQTHLKHGRKAGYA